MVIKRVARAVPKLSPQKDIAITVPKVATAVSKKLIPKSTVAKNFSGWATILATIFALG